LGDAISHRGHGSRYQRARGFASPRRLTYDPAMIWRPLTAIAIVLCTPPAWAQRAGPGALFDQGRALMEQGKTAEACAAFEQSMKLDPQRGTLYNLGLCHEKLGKIATAWSELDELSRTDTNEARAKDAAKHAAALQPRLPRMHVSIAKHV